MEKKSTQAIGATVQSYLNTVKQEVSAISNLKGLPLQVPNYDVLYKVAGTLDITASPEKKMFMISSLLGRASCVDMVSPSSDFALSFPNDHHLHTTMNNEWYWVGCHLNVTDDQGNTGRISMLLSTQKIRSVGLEAQQQAGWTDEQVTLADNLVTVTVDMGPNNQNIYRRTPNYQWPLTGGSLSFSKPGDNNFHIQCGSDFISGPLTVLSLDVRVDDGDNMQIKLTLTTNPNINVNTAHFLQGVPIPFGNGGTGLTPVPTPGIYYSWPQLEVNGTLSVGGKNYTVNSGTGWMDHQLMMASLQNPATTAEPNGAKHPIPFDEDPKPYNGWIWQFYNLNNGQAFTGAGFVLGDMITDTKMSYGYFLEPDGKGGWTAIFINGDMTLTDPQQFPAICNNPKDSVLVTIPISRTYANIENILYGKPLAGTATPWYKDGTFNNPNDSLCGESPADYIDTTGNYANGLGYLETVGFQKTADIHAYMLSFIQGGVL